MSDKYLVRGSEVCAWAALVNQQRLCQPGESLPNLKDHHNRVWINYLVTMAISLKMFYAGTEISWQAVIAEVFVSRFNLFCRAGCCE
jgi:hypothetical protein